MAEVKDTGPKEPISFTKPRLLIVEGKDESEFFESFISRMESHTPSVTEIQIIAGGGKRTLPDRLKTIRITPGFNDITNRVKSIGIVRDADTDPISAFQSIHNALRQADLPFPRQPLTPVDGEPKIVVMIMPGLDQSGALEDLCLKAVRNDPAIPCIEDLFLCLEQRLPEVNRPKHLSKARVQAFLASRKETLRDLGIAAQKGYWGDWDHEAFAEVRSFLEVLCS